MGGMVLETNMTEIMLRIEEQNEIEKKEVNLINFQKSYIILMYLMIGNNTIEVSSKSNFNRQVQFSKVSNSLLLLIITIF